MKKQPKSTKQPKPFQNSRPQSSPLAPLLDALVPNEGIFQTAIPGVQLARRSKPEPRHPLIYEPILVFLGSGRKRSFLGSEILRYDADNFLALSVPVPVECEVEASPDEPLLAACISVDPAMLAEILINLDEPARHDSSMPRGIYVSPLNPDLRSAVVRLLECLRSPDDARILGTQTVREILYRVLQSESGGALRALASRNDQFMRIARTLQQIHTDYARPLATEDLAKRAGMSVSTFHHNFKAVTATSPLQYLKTIRLHRARLLMTHSGHNAATAAVAVGYESPSQFGREFKRMFGASPAQAAANIRSRIADGHIDAPIEVHAKRNPIAALVP